MSLILHDYWRSGAAWRVRIALNLKGLHYRQVPHDLRTGAQRDANYRALNPQALVPALEAEGNVLTQSLAIIEWLEEMHPAPPLLPADPVARAHVRAMAGLVACDIHPLNNLRVLNSLRDDVHADDGTVSAWIARWINSGFIALEAMIERHRGTYAFGDTPTIADCFLVPQVASAQRFEVNLAAYPAILRVVETCAAHPAFAAAHPSAQTQQ
jgi:maleylpyruvate isomerase